MTEPLPKLSFRTGAAAKQPIGKPVVMFDWPPGSHTGWGVYGLNLMLHWARRSDLSLCCTQPINPVNLVVNPLEREVIGPVLQGVTRCLGATQRGVGPGEVVLPSAQRPGQ